MRIIGRHAGWVQRVESVNELLQVGVTIAVAVPAACELEAESNLDVIRDAIAFGVERRGSLREGVVRGLDDRLPITGVWLAVVLHLGVGEKLDEHAAAPGGPRTVTKAEVDVVGRIGCGELELDGDGI